MQKLAKVAIASAVISLAGAGLAAPAAQASPRFSNCTEAWKAGYGDISSDDPGYHASLDRDKDGIGCEWFKAPADLQKKAQSHDDEAGDESPLVDTKDDEKSDAKDEDAKPARGVKAKTGVEDDPVSLAAFALSGAAVAAAGITLRKRH